MYQLLFDSPVLAKQQIARQKRALTTRGAGLLGEFIAGAEAMGQLLEGSCAQADCAAESSTTDALGVLGVIRTIALFAQGDIRAVHKAA